MYLKPIECTKPRVNPKVNYGFWVHNDLSA